MTPAGGQLRLRRRGAYAAQRGHNRDSHLSREVRGLIEPAVTPPGRMKRHRNRAGGAGEHVGAADAHQAAQRASQRSPPFVLQCMDDRAQRAVIGADGARAVERTARPPAARAARQRQADHAPRRQRIAAPIAQRTGERQDRRPAVVADRPAGRVEERLVARGAGGREDDREDRVERNAA
jgi:hypothetical protein